MIGENENGLIASGVQPPLPPVSSSPVVTGEPPAGQVDLAPDPGSLQAEIDRLEQVRKEAEEKALYWRKQKVEARADYFRGGGERPPAPPGVPAGEIPGVGPEPKREDFDDYDQYVDAKVAHSVNKAKAGWDQEQARKAQDESQGQKMAGLRAKIDEGFTKFPDFEEVALDRAVPITPMVMEILTDSEAPADVVYYLGKNRAEAINIARMTPVQAARAIARIEMQIKAGAGPAPSPQKLPSAPPPIRPLGSSHTVQKDPDKMSQKEYEAFRESQGARRF